MSSNWLGMDDVEDDRYRRFIRKHHKSCCNPDGEGPIVSVICTTTGMGTGFDVWCQSCGETIGISNVDSW